MRTRPKPELTETKDGRVILRGHLYQRMRYLLWDLAKSRCETCDAYTPFNIGHAHHVRGRGAGKRDDRIWVPDEEGVLRRNLVWNCPECHGKKHVHEKVVPKKPPTEQEFKALMGFE